MPHRTDILTGLPRQLALALAISGMLAGVAPAATQRTAQPTPRELWRTYPLDRGASSGKIRLPPGSTARPAPARAAGTNKGGGGSGATVPILLVVALAALGCGLLLGRRRRAATAPSPALADQPSPRLQAAPEPEPPPASEPVELAEPEQKPATAPAPTPTSRSTPEPELTAEIPSEPKPEPPPEVAPAPPRPEPPPDAAPAPPLHVAPEPAPPSALDLEVERLRTGRFERRPWPEATERLWRCEIAWHAGYLSSGFRAMATEPGRRRAREVGRSEPQRLWGAAPPEPPTAELLAAADRLAAALLHAGWEPVEGGGDTWYAARFAWPHEEAPPRRLRVRSMPEEEVPHGA
ncbi:hypothetical protein [Baekduia sp.]|jgi:hypothetical protein|uniref:hypothetical protein n=1 Tax=Baekduia sp. TaxID=2600305 RepID=UPI002DF7C106|nr:hypothetical protein [Baekduia sp.]